MASQIENGIKSVRKEIDKILDRLEKFIKELSKSGQAKPTKKAASKKAPAKKAAPAKKTAVAKKTTSAKKKPAAKKAAAPKQSAKTETAFASVMEIINSSENGVETKTLMEKTGFNLKKISNIVFKAKNKGLIKAVKKGVYTKA